MPELPEVETVRRGLNKLIVGKTVMTVEHDYPKGFPNNPAEVDSFVCGATVTAVRRRAKVLIIDLSSHYSLVVHLKMTGQMVYRGQEVFGAGHPNDSLIGELPDSSTRVIIMFDDQSYLYFNDQRKFGWMKVLPTAEVENLPFMQKVGPEPLEADFTLEQFKARFASSNRNIKALLLDQTVVAGVGNIYADESLWSAKIDPRRLARSLSDTDWQALYQGVRAVMTLSIEKGGSTDKNYVDAEGKRGSYMDFAEVFRREGQNCRRCGQVIIKIKHAGRGTHLCPGCQQ